MEQIRKRHEQRGLEKIQKDSSNLSMHKLGRLFLKQPT